MYTTFASVYDQLMADVDYDAWAGFYRDLLTHFGIGPNARVCECACGTGSITLRLSGMGYEMTGVDLSAEMLFEASGKARGKGIRIPFVKQDMRKLALHRQMDAVLCTNDGLNYLADVNELTEFFTRAYACIREGGVLLMDLSTPYKLEYILGDHFIGDETADYAYLWQNRFNIHHGCVDMNLAIFVRQKGDTYKRIFENQRQYAHSEQRIVSLLEASGFTDITFYGDKKPEPPAAKESRWFIAARKPTGEEKTTIASRIGVV